MTGAEVNGLWIGPRQSAADSHLLSAARHTILGGIRSAPHRARRCDDRAFGVLAPVERNDSPARHRQERAAPRDGSLLRNLYEWTLGTDGFTHEYRLAGTCPHHALALELVER
jgi:hypothetical protein